MLLAGWLFGEKGISSLSVVAWDPGGFSVSQDHILLGKFLRARKASLEKLLRIHGDDRS